MFSYVLARKQFINTNKSNWKAPNMLIILHILLKYYTEENWPQILIVLHQTK